MHPCFPFPSASAACLPAASTNTIRVMTHRYRVCNRVHVLRISRKTAVRWRVRGVGDLVDAKCPAVCRGCAHAPLQRRPPSQRHVSTLGRREGARRRGSAPHACKTYVPSCRGIRAGCPGRLRLAAEVGTIVPRHLPGAREPSKRKRGAEETPCRSSTMARPRSSSAAQGGSIQQPVREHGATLTAPSAVSFDPTISSGNSPCLPSSRGSRCCCRLDPWSCPCWSRWG